MLGSTVYVVGHGPGIVIEVHDADAQKYKVEYPDGTCDTLSRGQILAHHAPPQSQSPAVSRSPSTRVPSSPVRSSGPRDLELLGRAFNDPNRNIRTPSATFSLVATMVGGGVLSLPFAMSRCGLVLGTAALFASALVSAWTLEMLVGCARRTGLDTFELVGHAAFGDLSRKGTVGLVFLLCWLALVAYFVLLGDLLVPIAELFVPATSQGEAGAQALRKVVMCIAAALLSPMCFAGSLHALRFMCYASVSSVLLVGMVVAMKAIEHFGEQHRVWIVRPDMTTGSVLVKPNLRLFPDDWLEALYAFPMFGVSFLCHFNALPTHQELQRPTRKRMRRVFLLTMALTSFLYLFVSAFGYIYACEYTCSNILLNFSPDDPFVVVARAALALVLMLNFPLITQPCRNSFYRLVLGMDCCPRSVGSPDGVDTGRAEAALSPERELSSPRAVVHVYQRRETAGHMSRNDARASLEACDTFEHKDATVQQGSAEPTVVQRWLLTALLLGAALAMSLFMQSVMVVWSILGSTVAMLVAFILPAAFWYRIVGPTAKTWQRRAAFFLIIIAVLLALVCTILTVFRLGSPACPPVKDMHSDFTSLVQ